MEPRAIAAIVEKIARSPLSVSAYFKRHKLPFGRSRYFQYKAQLAANGLDGLVDGRSGGNRRELTAHAQGFIRGVHREHLRRLRDYRCAGVASRLGATHGGDDCSGTGAVSQDCSVSGRARVA